MKIKLKGLKIEVKEFELDDSNKDREKNAYRKAIHQISVFLSKEESIEKIKEELKFMHNYPNL